MKLLSTLNKKKDKPWMEEYALALYHQTIGNRLEKYRDLKCWRYYHGYMNPEDWDYLTKIKSPNGEETFSLPSKIRNISIQRSPIDLLISQASRRPFILSTFINDNESKEKKQETMFIDMLDKIKKELLIQQSEMRMALSSMQQQLQQIQQQLQQQPQNEQQAQQQEELKKILPQLENQLTLIQEEISNKIQINEDKKNEIEEYYTYDYRDLKEILAQKGLKKLITEHNIRTQRVMGITDRFVTGKEYRFVDYVPEANKCDYYYLNSNNIFYPKIAGVDWVEDGPWAGVKDVISFNDFIDIYGDSPDLNDSIIEEIESGLSLGSDLSDESNTGLYGGTEDTSTGIERVRIYWRVPKTIHIGEKSNKNNPDIDFKHFYDNIIDENIAKQYKKITKRYMTDIYQAVIINGKYVVNARRKDEALIDRDNYMKRRLPIIGPSFSNIANQPYSLIWATKDLQDLFVLLHYHRELIIAVSGVKGQIIDIAQTPEGMTLEEHKYHKKTGNLYIETVKKTGKVTSPYNQWKDYDDTLPPSVQYIDNMLESIRNTALEIIGVPRQRLGQIVATDQVGTAEMAREQSMLITEILFYKHDEVEIRAMTQLINYYCKYAWKDGAILDIKNPDGIEYINIPKELLSGSDYAVMYENSSEEEQSKNELKQMAFRQSEKGQMPFEKVLDIYDMESLTQLKKSFRFWTKKSQELAQKSQTNQIEAQKQAEMELKKFDQDFEGMLKQQDVKLKELDLQLKKSKMELDAQLAEKKLQIDNKKIDTEANIKAASITSERDVELTYLGEQQRSAIKNEELQGIGLQLQAMQMNINALMEKNGLEVKMADIKVKEKVARKKEMVKD
jgi:hypothetical protein